jgi:hypothetical protein
MGALNFLLPEREGLFWWAGEAGQLAPRWAVQGDLLLAQVKAVPLYSILGEGSSISGLSKIVKILPDPESGSFFCKNKCISESGSLIEKWTRIWSWTLAGAKYVKVNLPLTF